MGCFCAFIVVLQGIQRVPQLVRSRSKILAVTLSALKFLVMFLRLVVATQMLDELFHPAPMALSPVETFSATVSDVFPRPCVSCLVCGTQHLGDVFQEGSLRIRISEGGVEQVRCASRANGVDVPVCGRHERDGWASEEVLRKVHRQRRVPGCFE